MLDLSMEAFELAFRYRNPVVILADGYLGQMTGRVQLPDHLVQPGLPDWAVWGDREHRGNLINSIYLSEQELEDHNLHLREKYARMTAEEQRANLYRAEDARVLLMACNTPARMAKGAVETLRAQGVAAGLFHPVTLWPFPMQHLRPLLTHVTDIVVVEAGDGQLEDELRLALSHADVAPPRLHQMRRMGGMLPSVKEIVAKVREGAKS
jgi:pyruvate/2-oxoacid:ferredoxin oxidoreductase alpha subunit